MGAELTEGETYTVKATTTNMSTKAGVPVAATLTINIATVVNSQVIMEDSEIYGFAAEETHTFGFSIAVPMGTGGKAGAVVAEVLDPNGNKLADGSLDVVITVVGAVLKIIPDVGGGCSIDKLEFLNPDSGLYEELVFNSETGKYEPTPSIALGQLAGIRQTWSAWVYYKTPGYWPKYGRSWAYIIAVNPDGTDALRQATPFFDVYGRGEENKSTFVTEWQWICGQTGIYTITMGVRNMRFY